MDGTKIERHVLVGTYRYGDGTVIEAVDEYLTAADAQYAYDRLAAEEQWAPHTLHTAVVMTAAAYQATRGLVPAAEQDTTRFIGALFTADRSGVGYGGTR